MGMDRRSFVMGLLGVAVTGSGVIAATNVKAAVPDSCALPDTAAVDILTTERLDEAPVEFTQSSRSPHWHHRDRRYRHHRRHVRRRRVCRTHFDRWGRRVRRCYWVWI